MPHGDKPIEGYNGLTGVQPTLPSDYYLDPAHHESELRKIWYRNWIYVCRASELDGPRAYRVFPIGSQEILILRDESENLKAFHNTCRHRGAILVENESGRLRAPSIICPYHRFSYDLDGRLQGTPSKFEPADFDKAQHSLYPVGIADWNGFLFVHLDPDNATTVESSFDFAHVLENWGLTDLEIGHTLRKSLQCNWKIFWENFNECLHCPNIHPELSRIVPLYKQSLMDVHDDPDWKENQHKQDPLFKAGLAPGARTWSSDGVPCADPFPDLTPEEVSAGHTYTVSLPSVFIVGHIDYVRAVRVLPLGPEETELQAQWLFRKETLAEPGFDPEGVAEFATTVIEQDGAASEMNQRGLHSIRHEHGVLMAEEYEVHAFHEWVNRQLGHKAEGTGA